MIQKYNKAVVIAKKQKRVAEINKSIEKEAKWDPSRRVDLILERTRLLEEIRIIHYQK